MAMSPFLHQLSAAQMERLKSRIIERMAQERLPSIAKVELFLTEDCNLRCDYCFVATKKCWRRMSWEVAQKSVDFLMTQSQNAPEVAITFFGGEPLLEFPLLRRTAEYAQQRASELGKQVRFAVTTNGTIMTEEMLLFAQKHGFNYLFSIDGDKVAHDRHRVTGDGKGSWDSIMGEPFRLLKSLQKWAGTRITVSPDTVDRLSAGVQSLFERGVNQFIISPNMDAEWTSQQMKTLASEMHKVAEFYLAEKAKGAPIRIAEFEETLERRRSKYCALWGCDAARTRVAVSTSGELYPCARFVSPYPEIEGRYRLGTVDEGITNLAARMEFMDNSDERRPKCAACRYRLLCAGGCPAVNLHTRGSIFLPCAVECLMTRVILDILSKVHAVECTEPQVTPSEGCPDDLPVAGDEEKRRAWSEKVSTLMPRAEGSPLVLWFSRGRGAGHAIPDMAIAEQLMKMHPEVCVQFVSYDRGADIFRRRGVPVIDLGLPEDNSLVETQRRAAILIERYQPQIVICHEEFAVPPVVRSFGLPCLFLTHWFPEADHPWMRMLDACDEIIFIEEPDIFPTPPFLQAKTTFVGPLIRSFTYHREDREQARQELDIPRDAFVVIGLPGSWQERRAPLFEVAVAAFDLLPAHPKLLIWVAGTDAEELRARVSGRADIRIEEFDPQIDCLMIASDVALTKATYTTTRELETLGVPSVAVLHGLNPIDEIYARVMSTVLPLPLSHLTPAALADALQQAVRQALPCSDWHFPDNGLVGAARRIAQHLPCCRSDSLPQAEVRSDLDKDGNDEAVQEARSVSVLTEPAEEPLTSIIILCCNQLQYTRLCVESVLRHTDTPYELIFVDNGSTDGTSAYLVRIAEDVNGGKFPSFCHRVVTIRNEGNLGFCEGVNQGIAAARGQYLLLLNNDTVVTSGWLSRLIEHAESAPDVGLVGAVSNYAASPQRVTASYQTLEEMHSFAAEIARRQRGRHLEWHRVVGFCLLIKREVINVIGILDEQFGLGFFEDDDLSLRARQAGYKILIAQDVFIHHFGSRTFCGLGIDTESQLKTNFRKFREKWGEAARGGWLPPEGRQNRQEHKVLVASPLTVHMMGSEECGVSIIVPCYNKVEYTRECLTALRQNTPDSLRYEVILIDNASTDGTKEFFATLDSNIHIVTNPVNLGFAKACNQGARVARGKRLLFLNNDTVPLSGWLEPMLETLESDNTTFAAL